MNDRKEVTKIVAASLLGDASVTFSKSINTCFSLTLIESHRDHLEYIQTYTNDITSSNISYPSKADSEIQYRTIVGVSAICQPRLRLRTKHHPFFTKFRERMYGTGRKSPDPHYLTLLDWEFLAVWYQQDGYLSAYMAKKVYPQLRLGLCTNGFSYGENMNLRAALKEKLNLDWTVTQDRTNSGNITYRLILAPKQVYEMCENIIKYIQPSFMYKVLPEDTIKNLIIRTNSSSQKEDDDMIRPT